MNTFVNSINSGVARTENGMKALSGTSSKVVDFFYKVGASRGKNVVPDFVAACVEDKDLAVRIALWARDIRGGAGERKLFRDILQYLDSHDPEVLVKVLPLVPELGRWDDLLVVGVHPETFLASMGMIRDALTSTDNLFKSSTCAKWMPRKGPKAALLREFLGWTPKFYRKKLVSLTKVVETQMCANDWDNINFNHVPSVAAARYKKAFNRHTPKYAEYVNSLVSGKEGVKVNAGAVYPYDVLKGFNSYYRYNNYNVTELDHIKAQWDALPNYMGDQNVLAMVDVSGSMTCSAGGSSSVTCLDVAVSLGLYVADKLTGNFKDTFLTFSGSPELLHLKGDIINKVSQMNSSQWAMNTNLHAAFDKILHHACDNNVPQEDMPDVLLILSDMQFDSCVRFDDSAMEMIKRKYSECGYKVPQVVFWNLSSRDNVPVRSNEHGVALVSGYSPSIMKAVLSANMDEFTPEGIMLKTVMNERYDWQSDKVSK